MSENYRIDHYYSLEAGGEIEEGHIFCTPAEAEEIERRLREALPDVGIVIEGGGEYDYTTEGMTAEVIAADILADTGFISPAEPVGPHPGGIEQFQDEDR